MSPRPGPDFGLDLEELEGKAARRRKKDSQPDHADDESSKDVLSVGEAIAAEEAERAQAETPEQPEPVTSPVEAEPKSPTASDTPKVTTPSPEAAEPPPPVEPATPTVEDTVEVPGSVADVEAAARSTTTTSGGHRPLSVGETFALREAERERQAEAERAKRETPTAEVKGETGEPPVTPMPKRVEGSHRPLSIGEAFAAAEAEWERLAAEAPEGKPKIPDSIIDARDAYARALRSQSKVFFGRTSKKELDQRRQEYHQAIGDEVRKKIDEMKGELKGVPTDAAAEAALNAKITDLVLTNQAEEQNALMMSMKDKVEAGRMNQFRELWKKSSKARMVLGAASIASVLSGQLWAAGVLQAARAPISGIGTTMFSESVAEGIRNKWGKAREMKDDADIKKLKNDELLRRIAAHETNFSDHAVRQDKSGKPQAEQFGVATRGYFKEGLLKSGLFERRQDTTGQRLMQEYRDRQETLLKEKVEDYQKKGLTFDQIAGKIIMENLNSQLSHHQALEQRRASNRNFAVAKWTTAVVLGAAASALTGLGAMRHLGRAFEGGTDSTKDAAAAARMGAKKLVKTPGVLAKLWQDAHQAADTSQAQGAVAAAGEQAPPSAESVLPPDSRTAEGIHDFRPDEGYASDTRAASKVPGPKSWGDFRMQEAGARAPTAEELASMQATKDAYQASQAAAVAAETAATTETAESAEVVVQKGDSFWKIMERALHDRMGAKFDDLDEARQTFMIDAMKDQVAANPDNFGLSDIDQLKVGQQLDLSDLFTGKEATDLGQLHEQATNLDQSAVDSINEHNEQLRTWVKAHPHEALTSEKAAEILTGKSQVPGTAGPILSEHARQIWANDLMDGLREKMLCDLAEQYPVEYAAAHEANPTLYPEVPGVTDQVAEAIHLTKNGLEAHQDYRDAVVVLYRSTLESDANAMMKRVGDMTVGEILHKNTLEKTIDEMEGGTMDKAKKFAKAVRRLIKNIPRGEYLNSDKFSRVAERLPEVRK